MQNNFFDQFPEFILQDTRNKRLWSPVTSESLSNRHVTSLPNSLINGCTVLDLGSCLGATGHWCLSNGATHYTGVEVQSKLASKSQTLLSMHWSTDKFNIRQANIVDFLNYNTSKYDIVVMVGVIYAFLDQYDLLKKVTAICNKVLVIDSIYPNVVTNPGSSIVQIVKDQYINSDYEGTSYCGVGARISPTALRLIMQTLGFEDKEGFLIPEPVKDKSLHDTYSTVFASNNLPTRYLLRFIRTNVSNLRLVKDIVAEDDVSKTIKFKDMKFPSAMSTKWSFDESVAKRFQTEAEQHIPDYHRVIDLCLEYTAATFNNNDINIIDVGSALGFTVSKFINNEYNNTYGVDSSQSMINSSFHADRITLSNQLPDGAWDVVLANWTLHFVSSRKEYIQRIYDKMNQDGLLILTDKMSYSDETNKLYYDFKRRNGVTEDVIKSKEQSLVGVLTCKPLQWYLDTLKEIGFRDIQVINSRYMFNTICARK